MNCTTLKRVVFSFFLLIIVSVVPLAVPTVEAQVGGTAETVYFSAGWNLAGMGTSGSLDVATSFGDATKVTTVWKWLPATSSWAFYAPSLVGQQLSDYAASKGYEVLTALNGGEGFWVNAKVPFAAQLPAGSLITSSSVQTTTLSGWNLIAIGDNNTPSQFNIALNSTPPTSGVIPNNIITLWSWNAGQSKWHFYAPSLEGNGTLVSYITGKGYLNFEGKVLGPTEGFWVNVPAGTTGAVIMAAGALGSVTFNVDSGRTASVSYPANGQASQLQVTDASGLNWRLDIPGDALAAPVTITMTALKDVSSPTMPGVINGGVLLEPDGLQLLAPATLTVTPPAGSRIGSILIGRRDGAGVEFAPSTAGENSVSAQIYHFSTGSSTSSDGAALEMLRQRALADYESAKAAALELLNQSVTVPPPPNIKLNCYDTSAYKDPAEVLAKYQKAVLSPENDVVSRLLGVSKFLGLLGEHAKSDEAGKMAQDVYSRLVKKTRLLVKTYAPQPEKFPAVALVALNVERKNQLLGGADDESTLLALASWAGKERDFYIDELRLRHDYTVIPALYYIARTAALLGASGSDAALQRIVNALTFTAYFDTAIVIPGANTLQYHVNGNVTINKLVGGWEGTSNGKYLEFTSTSPDVSMVLPNLFPVTARIENLDACVNNTVDVFISAIGADSETYVSPNGSAPTSPGMVKTIASVSLIEKFDQATSMFKFQMPLTNLDTEAARETFTKSLGPASFQYDLKLWHSPE